MTKMLDFVPEAEREKNAYDRGMADRREGRKPTSCPFDDKKLCKKYKQGWKEANHMILDDKHPMEDLSKKHR